MPTLDSFPDNPDLHQMIIMKIWSDLAPDIYRAYLEQGRGVVAMFMLDTMPDFFKDQLPEGEKVIGGSIMTTYIPLERLNTLEDLVGLEGVLKIDEAVHRYDPKTSIMFAFISKKVSTNGKRGVSCTGYEITPPSRHSPKELYKKKDFESMRRYEPKKGDDHPLINLN